MTVEVSVGDEHACALVSGRVWCWDSNSKGQALGRATPDGGTKLTSPALVLGL